MSDARLDEAQEIVGYVVWDKQLHTIYRGRAYFSLSKANEVLAGIVWHGRDRYEVRSIVFSGVPA